jgi:hypothetical protein
LFSKKSYIFAKTSFRFCFAKISFRPSNIPHCFANIVAGGKAQDVRVVRPLGRKVSGGDTIEKKDSGAGKQLNREAMEQQIFRAVVREH